MKRGRPLRFLVVVLGGWTAVRVALLWPEVGVPGLLPPVMAAEVPAVRTRGWLRDGVEHQTVAAWPSSRTFRLVPPPVRREGAMSAIPANGSAALVLAAQVHGGSAVTIEPPQQAAPGLPPPLAPAPLARGASRLAGSVWLIARGGTNHDPLAGQLGGSQVGARLTYALDRGRRIAASARIAGPLGGGGSAEAGIGLDWQPTRAPLHLLAEQRIPLGAGRGGPALLAVGGFGPVSLAPRLRAEAYAQGGVVFRGSAEGFGDGAARLTTPVATAGGVRLDLGAGAWGGIQRGARRLDLGPTLGATVPVARRSLRLTLDCGIMYQMHQANDGRKPSRMLMPSYAGRIRSDA